jgi:hypothetical protein
VNGPRKKLDSLQRTFNDKLRQAVLYADFNAKELAMKRAKIEARRKRKMMTEVTRRRRNTLFKKAHELGKVEGVKVAVIVF